MVKSEMPKGLWESVEAVGSAMWKNISDGYTLGKEALGQDSASKALNKLFGSTKKEGIGIIEQQLEDGTKQYWDAGRIALGFMGASAGYRVLSGGGIYRDSNGNTDIIGIPFV